MEVSDASSNMNGTHSVFCGDSEDCMPRNQKLNQAKKKRDFDYMYRQREKKNIKFLRGLVPDCSSKVTDLVPALDDVGNYVRSLQQRVEEFNKESKRLNAAIKQLIDENTMLKEQTGFPGKQLGRQNVSLQFETDPHGTNSEAADRFVSMELSASHPISNGDAAITDILMKLEADEKSTVEFSDFTGLDGERIKIGKYSVPLDLVPTVMNIINVYGDVFATGKMNPRAAEPIYIMFCASIKEMNDLRLEQVTEDLILKWRDAIKDALRINFKVAFAMELLKKIACAYIGLTESLKLENVALRIFDSESESSAGTEEINDKPVSPSEQPIIDNESVNGGDDDFDGVCRPIAGKKRKLTGSQDDVFLETSSEVENKLEAQSKLQLDVEVGLECMRQKTMQMKEETMQMKEEMLIEEDALKEKVKENEMLKRNKQDLLATEAVKKKLIDDFMVFVEAIDKNDMEKAQNFDHKTMMDTILTMAEIGHNFDHKTMMDAILTLVEKAQNFDHKTMMDIILTVVERSHNFDHHRMMDTILQVLERAQHFLTVVNSERGVGYNMGNTSTWDSLK